MRMNRLLYVVVCVCALLPRHAQAQCSSTCVSSPCNLCVTNADSYSGGYGDTSVGGSYSSARASALQWDATGTSLYVQNDLSGSGGIGTYYVTRSFLSFQLTSLPAGALVTSANLVMNVKSVAALSGNDAAVRVLDYNWTPPMTAGNFQGYFTGCIGAPVDATWQASLAALSAGSSYTSGALSTTYINAGNGTVNYCVVLGTDLSATVPTNRCYTIINSAESASPPYLALTFIVPTPTGPSPTPTPTETPTRTPTSAFTPTARTTFTPNSCRYVP